MGKYLIIVEGKVRRTLKQNPTADKVDDLTRRYKADVTVAKTVAYAMYDRSQAQE